MANTLGSYTLKGADFCIALTLSADKVFALCAAKGSRINEYRFEIRRTYSLVSE